MTNSEIFEKWAEDNGARAEVVAHGRGYTTFELAIANQPLLTVTVDE